VKWDNLAVFYYHLVSGIWPYGSGYIREVAFGGSDYKRGGLWWEWLYKRGGLWWEWLYKRGGLWWEWLYKRGTTILTFSPHYCLIYAYLIAANKLSPFGTMLHDSPAELDATITGISDGSSL
jgi:hypothetical protein